MYIYIYTNETKKNTNDHTNTKNTGNNSAPHL